MIPMTLHRWGVVVVVTRVVVVRMTGVAAVAGLVALIARLVILVAGRDVLRSVVVPGSRVDLDAKRAAAVLAAGVMAPSIAAPATVLRERSSGTEC